MTIFTENIKGDFIYAEWIDEDMQNFTKKCNELYNNGYKLIKEDVNFMNAYCKYKNENGHEIDVTVLCC